MCYDDHARPPLPPGATGKASGSDLVLSAADGNRFSAYCATPEAPATARLLLLPDVRGLHQFYKELALRFAEAGIATVALDYFGRSAGLGGRDESFEFMPHVMQLSMAGFFADATAALDYVQTVGSPELNSFSLGFCMGGTFSFHCGTQDLGLSGVIGFYAGLSRDIGGGGTMLERANAIRVPALGLFGGNDPGIPAEQIEAFDVALDQAGVEHAIITYPGAPHSFFDRRATDFADASSDAWAQALRFIAAHSAAQVAA